jgi:hypothetical protein
MFLHTEVLESITECVQTLLTQHLPSVLITQIMSYASVKRFFDVFQDALHKGTLSPMVVYDENPYRMGTWELQFMYLKDVRKSIMKLEYVAQRRTEQLDMYSEGEPSALWNLFFDEFPELNLFLNVIKFRGKGRSFKTSINELQKNHALNHEFRKQLENAVCQASFIEWHHEQRSILV